MNSTIDFNPNWASPPGDTISDILQERKIDLNEFAKRIKLTTDYVSKLLNGYVEITSDIAKKLESTVGASEGFWMKREQEYRNALIRLEPMASELWLKQLPLTEMYKLNWLKRNKNKLSEVLNFFNVSNFREWKNKYYPEMENVYFRKSTTFSSDVGSIAAWIRQGEILSETVECKPWDAVLFEKTLPEIKKLTRVKYPEDFLPKLKMLCAACGVALIVLKTPSGCKASGATKFLNPNKAILLLSFRYLSDDHFWFSFFHEAGHILLHGSKKTFLEGDQGPLNRNQDEDERMANLFAEEILIPADLRRKLVTIRRNKRDIINFAMEAGVSPGIVIGQLQHLKLVSHEYLNGYKRRYDWNNIIFS